MTTFKEQILADLETMLNPDEFAETVEFDGQEIVAVLELRKGQPEGNPGLIIEEMEIRAATSALPALKINQNVTINGGSYFVRNIERESGLTILFVYRNET